MEETKLYWLAGILEGEGSFMKPSPSSKNAPTISLQMTDEDVVRRVYDVVGRGSFYKCGNIRNIKWKPTYKFVLKGEGAVNLMRTLYPLMGNRRQQQIDNALNFSKTYQPDKVNKNNIDDIMLRLQNGEKHSSIAEIYGVSRSYISHIARGRLPKNS